MLRRCRARYGPVFTLRFSTVGPVAVVADSSSVVELLGSDPDYAHAGEARRSILPQASPDSSFGADEVKHAQARHLSESEARLVAWQSYCQTLFMLSEFLYVG